MLWLSNEDIRDATKVTQRTVCAWRMARGSKLPIGMPYSRDPETGKIVYESTKVVKWMRAFNKKYSEDLEKYICRRYGLKGPRKRK